MEGHPDVANFIGHDVVDRDGETLGRVKHIYQDQAADRPSWALVQVYALDEQPTFVPLDHASSHGEDLQIVYDAQRVMGAPPVQAVDSAGRVPFDGRAELYRYYLDMELPPFEIGGPRTFP